MTTKVPTIPPTGAGSSTDYILTNIKMLLDVREGRSGDKLDSNVTYRDLVSLGLAKDPTGAYVYTGATATTTGLPVRPQGTDNDGYDPEKDLTPPPEPASLAAFGSIGVIFLSWSQPTYRNHSYAEVWRNETNDVATASFIGTSSSQGYVDVPNDQITRYYWVRFVSRASVKGTYTRSSVSAKADLDPAVVISKLEGQINETSLAKSLATKLSKAGSVAELTDTMYTVKIDNNGHVAGFGLASETVGSVTSSAFIIRADKFAIIDPADTSGMTTTPAADTVPFFIDGGTTYIKAAMIKDASITNAKISSLSANKITAGYINAVVGINGAKVYGAEFYSGGSVTVNTDTAGNVTGFTPANTTVKIAGGNATFVAGSFKVANSATGTPTDYTPFEVVSNVVYIKSAMIKDATVTLAKIDTASITNLSSIKANMGTITAGKMQSTDGKMVVDLDNKYIKIEV